MDYNRFFFFHFCGQWQGNQLESIFVHGTPMRASKLASLSVVYPCKKPTVYYRNWSEMIKLGLVAKNNDIHVMFTSKFFSGNTYPTPEPIPKNHLNHWKGKNGQIFGFSESIQDMRRANFAIFNFLTWCRTWMQTKNCIRCYSLPHSNTKKKFLSFFSDNFRIFWNSAFDKKLALL